jgi:hypothetical protein
MVKYRTIYLNVVILRVSNNESINKFIIVLNYKFFGVKFRFFGVLIFIEERSGFNSDFILKDEIFSKELILDILKFFYFIFLIFWSEDVFMSISFKEEIYHSFRGIEFFFFFNKVFRNSFFDLFYNFFLMPSNSFFIFITFIRSFFRAFIFWLFLFKVT